MTMAGQNRILIVDDEPDLRSFFRDVAEDIGFVSAEAGDQDEFASAYERLDPTVVLLDLTMPDTDGVEFLRNLAKRNCTAPVILVSGQDERVIATAERLGRMFGLDMRNVLQKPVGVTDLEAALQEVRTKNISITADTLSTSITEGELVLHFQPKIGLQSGDGFPVVGSEALARWNHPAHGLLPPNDFVPLAEESGLIGKLSDEVLRQAITQIGIWQRNGIALPVAVNLSPKQLTDLTLPDRIAELVAEANIERPLLTLEVTEQAAMADTGKAMDILTRLRLKDITIALDDFGAGYSSLVEIYRMPFSELKLDRSLITDIDTSRDARTVVRALVALAQELKMPVCAEGVETENTVTFLQDIGCEIAQGFFFAKPMPADEFAKFVAAGSSSEEGAGEGSTSAAA
ncbi:EAL domain-containing response regulator [Parasphingopyxis algicola]|uniref:EAL domain-containing response regulator n=1 Tax=Parasphingopyxis algicola TaxID=2026624 RepID=UPI0015A18907|nr:EAL domain-containing response regulator [Parasphingopyxis algicola]QLC24950.1 EAL domain-containing response regulator [Parasphingopyxis algicola]